MKINIFIRTVSVMILLGINCYAEDSLSLNGLRETRKSTVGLKRVITVEPIRIAQKYGNTPEEYNAAIGIMNYYKAFKNPGYLFILDYALSQKNAVCILNEKGKEYGQLLDNQEKYELEKIRNIKNQHNIKGKSITLNAARALYLYEENKAFPYAVDVYLSEYKMRCYTQTITPAIDTVITCLDNEVPFMLKTNETLYLALGYIDDSKQIQLIVSDMNKTVAINSNSILDLLEETKTMKNKKEAERIKKHCEEKIKAGLRNFYSSDYIFSLKTADDKPFIKIIDWTPSPDQKMTIIYPPKCDKDAMSTFLKIELLGVTL